MEIAATRSISGAAKKLYVAQPSLSQFLRKVEERIGARLFERRRDGLELTFVGRQYLEHARSVQQLQHEFASMVEDYSEGKSGHVTIGIPPVRSAYILPRVLPTFRRKYPRIEPKIHEDTNVQVHRMLEEGQVDVGFLHLPTASADISHHAMFHEEILLAVPPDHPLASRFPPRKGEPVQDISPRLIKEEPFILLRAGQRIRIYADRVFQALGCKPNTVLEISSNTTAERLAFHGHGLTFVVDSLVAGLPPEQACRYFRVEGVDNRWHIVLAYNNKRYLSKATRTFIGSCVETYTGRSPKS